MTMAGAMLAEGESRLVVLRPASGPLTWPSSRYLNDPVGFAHDILGIQPTTYQIEIVKALAAKKDARVAVASGHKIGKSFVFAWFAFWFYCTFSKARVVLTSSTSNQIDAILWREITALYWGSGWCLDCKRRDPDYMRNIPRPCPHSALIDGEMHDLARNGLRNRIAGREIVGFTAAQAENIAGISGPSVAFLIDEASGVPEFIFETIMGNRMGRAVIGMISNPTRTEGTFFEAFDSKKEFWKTFQISSEYVASLGLNIPGIADAETIADARREYGVDSPWYKVRVLGQFVQGEDGKVLTLHAIAQAEQRWQDAKAVGRLIVGLDPAGPGTAGDESVWAPRRGPRVMALRPQRGLSEDAHVAITLDVLRDWRLPQDGDPRMIPLVVVDREGPIGAKVYAALCAHAEAHPDTFEVLGVRSSDRAVRQPFVYDRIRDELWGNLASWLKTGAIPEDAKLSKELHSPEFTTQIHGRLKVTDKAELRKRLGRSPDRADALALAAWVDDGYHVEAAKPEMGDADDGIDWAQASGDADRLFDPYKGI